MVIDLLEIWRFGFEKQETSGVLHVTEIKSLTHIIVFYPLHKISIYESISSSDFSSHNYKDNNEVLT